MPTKNNTVKKFFPNVVVVQDAKKPLHIEVTRRDSNSAAVRNHKGCAMAVAAKRCLNLDGVVISRQRAYLIKGNIATRYSFPESVRKEIVSFDRGGGFDEGVYRLTVPVATKPAPKKPKGETHGNSSHYKREFHSTTNIRAGLGGKGQGA
jgi:hypothetical protein